MARGNGLDAFRRRLAKVPVAVRKAVNEAIEKDAEEWVRAARFLAPDDPATVGEDLKASIRHRTTDTGGQLVQAGGKTTMRKTPTGEYDYAVGLEFGTQKMPAHPFFWPSYRFLKKRFQSRRRAALRKAIREFYG